MLIPWRIVAVLVVTAMLALAAGIAGTWWWLRVGRSSVRESTLTQTHLLTVDRIGELSALTTLKVEVADVQVTEIRGKTGAIKAVLVVRGNVTIGVDLSASCFSDVDDRRRTATLTLPTPRVQTVRLDHEKTRLIGMWQRGLWQIAPGCQEADTVAVNLACTPTVRAVLRVCFATLGWEVTFQPMVARP